MPWPLLSQVLPAHDLPTKDTSCRYKCSVIQLAEDAKQFILHSCLSWRKNIHLFLLARRQGSSRKPQQLTRIRKGKWLGKVGKSGGAKW